METNKKNKSIIIILVILLILGIVIFLNKDKMFNKNEDSIKIYEEYSQLKKDNVFKYIDVDGAINFLETETGIISFGFPECTWCQAYFPILDEVAKENNIGEIYYYNILEIRTENTDKYQKIVSIVSDYLYEDQNGDKRVYVPDIYFVKDGKIIGHNNDTSTISNGSPETYYSKHVRDKLKEDLQRLVDKTYNCSDNAHGGC